MKSTEQLTRKFLTALASCPKETNQWSAKSAQEICTSLGFSNEEWKRVMDYMWREGLIEQTKKDDSFIRVRSGRNAEAWIGSHSEPLTLDRRLVIYGILISVLLAAVALLWQLT